MSSFSFYHSFLPLFSFTYYSPSSPFFLSLSSPFSPFTSPQYSFPRLSPSFSLSSFYVSTLSFCSSLLSQYLPLLYFSFLSGSFHILSPLAFPLLGFLSFLFSVFSPFFYRLSLACIYFSSFTCFNCFLLQLTFLLYSLTLFSVPLFSPYFLPFLSQFLSTFMFPSFLSFPCFSTLAFFLPLFFLFALLPPFPTAFPFFSAFSPFFVSFVLLSHF